MLERRGGYKAAIDVFLFFILNETSRLDFNLIIITILPIICSAAVCAERNLATNDITTINLHNEIALCYGYICIIDHCWLVSKTTSHLLDFISFLIFLIGKIQTK